MVGCASSGQMQKIGTHDANDYYDEDKGTRQKLIFR